MEIRLKTLTPLWTGGVDQTTDRLHETGLIGSLRWWYEALVRGLGGYACDPTEQTCIYDANKPHHGLCIACQMFGTTGWARRFRLIVRDTSTSQDAQIGQKSPNGNRYKRNSDQHPTWYFKGPGRGGEIRLSFIPTSDLFDPILIIGALKMIEKWGGLAAKTQLGYGRIEIVKIENAPNFDVRDFVSKMAEVTKGQPSKDKDLPSLSNMFFAQVITSDAGITATLNLRYDVRAALRTGFEGNTTLRHWVCGTVQGEREASKVFFSQAVNGLMYVWGWIPKKVPVEQVTRDEVVDKIKETVGKYGKLGTWREFNSPRDTVAKIADVKQFLTDLL